MSQKINSILLIVAIALLTANLTLSIGNYSRSKTSTNTEEQKITQTETEVKELISNNFLGENISDKEFQIGRLKGEVEALKDDYSEYQTKDDQTKFNSDLNQSYKGIGVMIEKKDGVILIVKVFEGSPAKESGVEKGDIITKVGDTSVISQKDPKIDEVVKLIRGEEGTKVDVEVARGGETKKLNITRRAIKGELVTLDVKGSVAVIRIDSFGEDLNTKMNDIANTILADSKITKIVVDVRSNTGGLLNEAVDVLSYFVPSDSIIIKEKRKTKSVDAREMLAAKASGSYEEKDGYSIIGTRSRFKNNSLIKYPVTVVVDSFSASASEIVAGALRDVRGAKIYGQNTFGKGVVQQIFELKNEDFLKLTIAEWLTPNGTQINKIGIKPDLELEFKIDALEKALEDLKQS
jgi:carboxyl-terminal processing protease